MIKVNKMDRVILSLSQEHDNDANGIQFDVSEWVQKFGPGTITLTHKRKGDKLPYPVNLEVKGNVATWIISDVDTAKKGYGSAQLMYQPEDTDILAQSAVARTLTMSSNYQIPSTPEPFDNWMAELAKLAGTSKLNADHAKESAEQAAASEQATREMRESVSGDKAEIESKIAVAEHDIDAKMLSVQRYIEEEKAGLDETIETAEGSIEASVNTAIQEAEAATAAKNAATQKAAEASQSAEESRQQAAEAKHQYELAAGEAVKAAASKAAAAESESKAKASADRANTLVTGFDKKVADETAAAIQTINTKQNEAVNAVQEVIDTIPEDYSAIIAGVDNVKREVATKADKDIVARLERENKAVRDLLNGKLMDIQTVDYNAVKIEVPSGAVADSVLKIGGHSRTTKNAVKISVSSDVYTEYGVTLTNNKDGTLTVRGTAAENAGFNVGSFNVESGAQYRYTSFVQNTSSTTFYSIVLGGGSWSDTLTDFVRTPKAFTHSTAQLHIYVLKGQTVDVTFKPMLVKGTTAPTEFEPYFVGIISSQTDAVEIRGKNLFDGKFVEGKAIVADGTIGISSTDMYSESYIEVKPFENIYMKKTANGTYVNLRFYDKNKTFIGTGTEASIKLISGLTVGNPLHVNTHEAIIQIIDPGIRYMRFNDVGNANYATKYSVSYSPNCPAEYPYDEKYNKTIPTNLPELKSAETVYDYIERSVTFPNMKSVDMGTLGWIRHKFNSADSYYVFYANVLDRVAKSANSLQTVYGLTKDSPNDGAFINNSINTVANSSYVYIRDDDCVDVNSLKAKLNGVILHYEATEGGEDYTTNVFHQRTESVDLGTLEYARATNSSGINYMLSKDWNPIPKGVPTPLKAVCSLFTPTAYGYAGSNKYDGNIALTSSGTQVAIVPYNESDTMDGVAFKLAMNGVFFNYELANERIIEIPRVTSELDAINVEAGGQLTFVDHSELAMPIPSTHEWIVKNSEV